MPSRSQRHLREHYGRDSSEQRNLVNQVTPPTVAGTPTNGQILTGTDGTYKSHNNAARTITRQWLRNGVVIAGQTLATYMLTAADVGKRIQFQNTVTTTQATRFPQTFQSAQTAVVA